MDMRDQASEILCTGCGAFNRVPSAGRLSRARCGRCAQALATAEPVEISDDQLQRLEGRDTGNFVIDLWAPWCGPCRMMAPAYASAARRFQEDVRFFKVNTDQHPEAAQRLQIRGVPTLMAWSGGKLLAHQAGAQSGPAMESWVRGLFQPALSRS